ncbi:phage tail protein [Megamonas sp.]|jgi:phage protein U|uniref:phage tail protein n=1 Tax=Megamonas TaxID=158846 RepID=UPI002586D1D9|nr:phage tail protein [Megamonas sp.]MBD9295421.1 phage tail protein [Megamonas funiformis]
MFIGTFGNVVFETSNDLVRTFKDMTRDTNVRLASHDIIGKKPVIEWIGPGTDTIKFSMQFNSILGVEPKDEEKKLRDMAQTGKVAHIIVGGEPISDYKFIIESISSSGRIYDRDGNLIKSMVDITVKEYPENVTVTQKGGTNGNTNNQK